MPETLECSNSQAPILENSLIDKEPKQSRLQKVNESLNKNGQYKYKTWCGFRRSTCILILYIVFYILFIMLGALAMATMEQDNLNNMKREAIEFKREFIKRNNVSDSEIEKFISDVLNFESSGVSMLDADLNKTEWSLGESILMVVVTVTTIGYGHLTPITEQGKLFIVLYAMVGLPLTVVLLTVCVQKLEGPILKLIHFLERSSSCCQSRLSSNCIKLINLVILTLIFWIFIITIPSLIFWLIEYPEWSQMDSFYFVFISITTIGFGDLVPGDHPEDNGYLQDLYKIFTSVFLVMSLIMVGLTGIAFYDIPQLKLEDYLDQNRDLYLSNSQLCGPDIEKIDEEEENLIEK